MALAIPLWTSFRTVLFGPVYLVQFLT